MKDQGWGSQKGRFELILCNRQLDNYEQINEWSSFEQENTEAKWISPMAEHNWVSNEQCFSNHALITE